MEPLFRWWWPGLATAYLWLVLLAGYVAVRRARAPAERRPGFAAPLLFGAAVTTLQQAAVGAAIASRLVQRWEGLAAGALGAAVLVAGGVLWLQGQVRARPRPARLYLGLLAVAALPALLLVVNGLGWSRPPAPRTVEVGVALETTAGPFAHWFVHVPDLGQIAVEERVGRALSEGGEAVILEGRGLLGLRRVAALRPSGE